METTITRTQTAFRLSTELLKRLKTEARKQNRSLRNPDHGRPVNPFKIPLKRYSFTY